MAERVADNLTQKEYSRQAAPFALDLIALFQLMQEDALVLVRKARRENWTPERLIREITNLLET